MICTVLCLMCVQVGVIVPLISYVGTFYTFSYLRIVTVYEAYRHLDPWLEPALLLTRAQRQIGRMVILLLSFLVVMACTTATLETVGDPDDWSSVVSPTG